MPKGRGRPKMTEEEKKQRAEAKNKKLDKEIEIIEEMASLMTSKEDIAAMLLTTVEDLEKKILKYKKISLDQIIAKAEAKRRLSLKNDMFALSKKNGTVAIHLSKLYLEDDDTDNVEFQPFKVEIVDGSKDEKD